MKKLMIVETVLISLIITISSPNWLSAQKTTEKIQVFFSPNGGATEAILKELRCAKKIVLIHAYQITSAKIEKEIGDAHRRGVNLEIIIDHKESTAKDSRAIFLFKQGVTILTDKKHQKSHNKVLIIDEEIVITGSFNFSKNAERNAENIVIIRDTKISEIYLNNFKLHAAHSKPFDPNNK